MKKLKIAKVHVYYMHSWLHTNACLNHNIQFLNSMGSIQETIAMNKENKLSNDKQETSFRNAFLSSRCRK